MKLLVVLILISLSSIPVFAESENDIEILNDKGRELFALGELEKAISYFDQALEIEPDNVTILNDKGNALNSLEKYYEASKIFDKVLEIIPENFIAETGLKLAKKILYEPIDGMLEITIRNSQGNLIGYITTTDIQFLDHDVGKKIMDQWKVKEIVTRDGQDYEVIQDVIGIVVLEEERKSYTKMDYRNPSDVYTKIVFGQHNAFQLDKGDRVSLFFTLFRPIE